MAEVIRCGAGPTGFRNRADHSTPDNAVLSLSVAPLVKMMSDGLARDLSPGLLDRCPGFLAKLVNAGWIAVVTIEVWHHRGHHVRVNWRGGRGVEVDRIVSVQHFGRPS